MSPRGAFIYGALGFALFYFVLPWPLIVWANYNKAKMTGNLASMWGKVIDEVFVRRFIHPSEFAGIAIFVVCTFVGVWKLITWQALSRHDVRYASFFSRLFSRWLD